MSEPPPPDRAEDDVFDHLIDDEAESDLTERADEPAESAVELDEQRIRHIATLRRALYRSRSYAIVAMCAAAVVGVQLAMMTYGAFRRDGHWLSATAMLIGTMVCAIVAHHFYRRAVALHQEAKQTHLSPPTDSADFATLSDGSQRWKNLEDVR